MPPHLHPQQHPSQHHHHAQSHLSDQDDITAERCELPQPHIPARPSPSDAQDLSEIVRTLSRTPQGPASQNEEDAYAGSVHSDLDSFLKTKDADWSSRGLPLRRLGVRFLNVTTWGEEAGGATVKTFAEALGRTVVFRDLYEWWVRPWIASKRQRVRRRALVRDVSGIVRDGEMMLVLGRPGSGCTTLLRTVTSNHTSYLAVDGTISYSGGLTPHDIRTSYRGDVVYMPEEDTHFPHLTVRQTLEFAFRCKLPRAQAERAISTMAKVFGISHVLDTLVGNEHVRGVSGGERKRLSCIETLATDAVVVAWDGSTRGLDASATVDYARSLRILTDVGRKATIVSLYQASEEVWELMDKVLLLDEGRMIFQGPIRDAKRYFEDLGYECPNRRTTADFLTSITNPGERRFREGWEHRAPKGAVELEKAFRESEYYAALMDEVESSEARFESQADQDDFSQATKLQKQKYTRKQSNYTIHFPAQVMLCLKRQYWQVLGNISGMVIRALTTIANALVMGSLFYNQPVTSDGAFSRGGFVFYTSIFLGWIQLAELEEALSGREILARQKGFAFVRPSAVAVARTVMDLPLVFVQAVIFVVITYFMAGMKDNVGAFFTFFIFIYMVTIELTALYRMFASFSPTYEVAVRYCGLTLLIYIVFGGYTLPLKALMADAPWFGWLAYINPIYYTFEALMTTEFHNLKLACSKAQIIPYGPSYTDTRYQTCALPGNVPEMLTVLGDDYVRESFGYSLDNVWRNFGIIVAFTVGLWVAGAVGTEVFDWSGTTARAVVYSKKQPKIGNAEGDVEGAECVKVGNVHGEKRLEGSERGSAPGARTVQLDRSKAIFTWKNLVYTIPPTKAGGGEGKRLLNRVNGICRPGEMTALIGSSGAGKTTLLSILSQRGKTGTVTGEMRINGLPLPADFERSTGLCEQMDIHDPSSTILEAFTFSALLRQDPDIPHSEKLAYVDTVIDLLDLRHLKDALIGSLALEQKKRTTIGVELCARPKLLLFLDEPTSGLDSQGAYNIVCLLRKLADEGQSILCTIHQASQQIIEMFDRVLALNPGGNTFYCGPVGRSTGGGDIIRYFERYGVSVRDGKNVADFLIEVGRGLVKSSISDAEKLGQNNNANAVDWNKVWSGSPEHASLLSEIASVTPSRSTTRHSSIRTRTKEFSSSTLTQTRLLTTRLTLQFWRTPEYGYSRLYASFLHSLLNGFTFYKIGSSANTSLAALQARSFSIFLLLMIVPEYVNAVAYRFILNKSLFHTRELPSRIYTSTAFTTANLLSEIPYIVLCAVVFFLLWFFPTGFPIASAGYVFLMMLVFNVFSVGWGQWIAALAPDYNIAANLIPFFIIMCESFNGILREYGMLPGVWRYTMYHVNPMTYFVRGMLGALMEGREVRCAEGEFNTFKAPPGVGCADYVGAWLGGKGVTGYLAAGNTTAVGQQEVCKFCRYGRAEEYLRTLNVGPGGQNVGGRWADFGVFLGFAVVNWGLVYLFMWKGEGWGVARVRRRVRSWVGRVRGMIMGGGGESRNV
ncbi:ABC transporter CDR4 [Peziza echinospora]|nr:ABC transporter CDR4 [Peziza echinospora]